MLFDGIAGAFLALKDSDTNKLIADATKGLSANGIYELDHSVLGVAEAKITGLQGKQAQITGNNTIQYVYSDPTAPTVALTVNDLPIDIGNKLTGVSASGLGYADDGTVPLGAVIVKVPSLRQSGVFVYYAFPSGSFTLGDPDFQSDDTSKKNITTDALTFAAITDDNIGGKLYKTFLSTADGFSEDAMFKDLFPDYVAASNTGAGTGTGNTGS